MLERLFARWPLKLLAALLAYLLWLAVTGQHVVPQVYDIPLGIDLGENLVVTGEVPSRVQVRLRGPEGLMRRVNALGLELRVALGEETGERSVLLRPENVLGAPSGVEVEVIEPDRLTITVAQRISRRVPVVPQFQGEPADGFAFYGSRILPNATVIVGPEEPVSDVSRLLTEPIRLDGRTSSFSKRVEAIPETPEVRILNAQEHEVRVEIDEAPVEAVFEEIPVVLAGQVFEAETGPTLVTVTLSGPPSLLARIEPGQLRAVADVSELKPRRNRYEVTTRLEFVGLTSNDILRLSEVSPPRKVGVRISDRRIQE